MNSRERFLAIAVLSLMILGGGGFLFNLFFLGPLNARRASIQAVQAEIQHKQERIAQVQAERDKLVRWRKQSLPADADQEQMANTRRLYAQYLSDLLAESGISTQSVKIVPQKPDTKSSPTLANKKPIYTKLTFTVDEARGNLDTVVKLLERFYHTNMLHQIKKLSVQRPRTRTGNQQPDDLDVNLTIEALVINGAETRPYLPFVDRRVVALDSVAHLENGPGLGLALWTASPDVKLAPSPLAQPARYYSDILSKNIFFPSEEEKRVPEAEVTRFVYLTDITRNARRTEAFLYDRYNNRSTRLRASAGFNSFRVVDSQDETVVRGQVLRIEDRDIYLEVDKKYYVLHVGQNLDDALRSPLNEDKVKDLKALASR